MTFEEMRKGYQNEVAYQKHMLRNLGYWFQLGSILSGSGIVLVYFFHAKNIFLNILGIALLVLGTAGMLLFGYAGWKGQRNLQALIDDYEQKLDYLQKQVSYGKR